TVWPGERVHTGRLAVSSPGGMVCAAYEIAVVRRDRWFPDRVFRGPDGCRLCRTDRTLGDEESRSEHVGPDSGRGSWFVAGRPGGGDCAHCHGRFCASFEVAGGISVGSVFSGRG